MCGIAGILNLRHQPVDPAIIHRMNDAMAHRGPDADGFFKDNHVALGQRRLSIIDLSEVANQPLYDPSNRYVIIFNGEIYNFREVKTKLNDYPFTSNGDSEVILAAYIKWGAACLDLLAGMFAIVIWDRQLNEMFIARDRMGVKPLYYFADDNHFLFASEVRALLKSGLIEARIDDNAIEDYLEFQSVGYSGSIIKNIQQLSPGCYMKIGNGKISIQQYWDITALKNGFDFNDKKSVEQQLHHLLRQSVQRRLISDVPLGAFLSGGIDSSAVVALMAEAAEGPVNTFTIGFNEEAYDESPYAALIAKKFNTCHTNVKLSPSVYLDEFTNALDSMDSPSGDGINTYVVSKQIRQSGLTVALSGVGGDELFAGYPFFSKYYKLQQNRQWWKLAAPFRKMAAKFMTVNGNVQKGRVKQLLQSNEASIDECYPVFRQIITPNVINLLTEHAATVPSHIAMQLKAQKNAIEQFPYLSQVSIAEYAGYTLHTLLKDTDQMSMAVSLEVREPFFDHELVEFALQIPDRWKYPQQFPKQLLVESLGDLLPNEIVHRKKQGFQFPWSIWMKNELKSFSEERIKNICDRPFIHGNALMDRWNKFLKADPSVRWMELWLFIILEHWLEKNDIR